MSRPYQRIRWIKKGITLYSHYGENVYLADRYGQAKFFKTLEGAEGFIQKLFDKRRKKELKLNEL